MLDKSRCWTSHDQSRCAENWSGADPMTAPRSKGQSRKTAFRSAAAGACAIVMPRNINRSLSLRDTKLVGLISWPRISISSYRSLKLARGSVA